MVVTPGKRPLTDKRPRERAARPDEIRPLPRCAELKQIALRPSARNVVAPKLRRAGDASTEGPRGESRTLWYSTGQSQSIQTYKIAFSPIQASLLCTITGTMNV